MSREFQTKKELELELFWLQSWITQLSSPALNVNIFIFVERPEMDGDHVIWANLKLYLPFDNGALSRVHVGVFFF